MFLHACGAVGRPLKAVERECRQTASGQAAGSGEAPAPDLHLKLVSTYKAVCPVPGDGNERVVGKNLTTSIFELKGGIRAASFEPNAGASPLGDLNAVFQKAQKAMTKTMQSTCKCVFPIPIASQRKKIEKTLVRSFDSGLFTKYQLPQGNQDHDWVTLVHDFVWFGTRKFDITVGYGHMCLIEARLLFEGELLIAAAPTDAIRGSTAKEKRANLITMDNEELLQLITKSGCVAKVIAGEMFVLPTGFMWILSPTKNAYGLRWTLAADESDTARATRAIQSLFESFPEMMNDSKGYKQFFDYIQS